MNSQNANEKTIVLAFCLLAVPLSTLGQDLRRFSGLREWNPPAGPDADVTQAIVGAALVDGRGGPVVEDSVILIRGNTIDALGDRTSVEIPLEAKVFDAAGLSVLPGLLDSHFHIGSRANMYDIPPLFLSHGVTSVRDPGRPIDVYAPVRGADRAMPRCFLTGPHFDQAPAAFPQNAVLINSPAEARDAVRRYVEQGASGIKIYYRLPVELIRETCQTAHELTVPVTAHLELVDADQAIAAGPDGIEHVSSFSTVLAEPAVAEEFRGLMARKNAFRGDARYRLWAGLDLDRSARVQPILDLIVESGVFISPTLATMERRAGDEETQEFHVRGFENMLRFVGRCQKAGATIVTGSHTFSRYVELGWAYQREMELLVEAGLTPMETITASTLNNARFFGCADRLGTIEPQKLADLVLVKGDPSTNIRAMYDIQRVMLNGKWVTSNEVVQVPTRVGADQATCATRMGTRPSGNTQERSEKRSSIKIFDSIPKHLIVNGYSTSVYWPGVLQRKLDKYFKGKRTLKVVLATRSGSCIPAWIDIETGEPSDSWLEVLRPSLMQPDAGPRIVLAQQSIQGIWGNIWERGVGIRSETDTERIKRGADVMEKYVRLMKDDGADLVVISTHIYKHHFEPHISNERFALNELLQRQIPGIHRGPDVWTPMKENFPEAFSEDQIHPRPIGWEIIGQYWFETLLKYDGLQVPKWSRQEMEDAITKGVILETPKLSPPPAPRRTDRGRTRPVDRK